MTLKEKIRIGVAVAVGVLLLLFIVLNFNAVDIFFLIGTARVPLAVGLIASAAMGAGAMWLLMMYRRHKDKPRDPAV